jgi:hypothetical protein
MTRCPPTRLTDLDPVLAAVRTWAGVVEKTPGVFYLHREPFLHFHLTADGHRRADIKGSAGWTPVELPRRLSARGRARLLRALRCRYAERPVSKSTGRSGRKSRSKASQSSFE